MLCTDIVQGLLHSYSSEITGVWLHLICMTSLLMALLRTKSCLGIFLMATVRPSLPGREMYINYEMHGYDECFMKLTQLASAQTVQLNYVLLACEIAILFDLMSFCALTACAYFQNK